MVLQRLCNLPGMLALIAAGSVLSLGTAGARQVLSPDTAATHPGRAVLRSRQVLAAGCAWSRAGARAGAGFGA